VAVVTFINLALPWLVVSIWVAMYPVGEGPHKWSVHGELAIGDTYLSSSDFLFIIVVRQGVTVMTIIMVAMWQSSCWITWVVSLCTGNQALTIIIRCGLKVGDLPSTFPTSIQRHSC
jgi:hypothetical protein